MMSAPLKFTFVLIFLLVLLAPAAGADEINPQEIGYLEADLEFVSYIGSSGKIDNLNHSVYIIPDEYSDLEVDGDGDFIYSIGKDENGNRMLEIFWKDFEPQTYTVRMKVINSASFKGPKKTPFPYSPPQETFDYLAESEYVVITDEIRERASEIVQGSTNGFEAVSRISGWIYSGLEYDLSYGEEILPSDRVYEIRRGTCDEFTNLFLAMCRSVGIPGRYVAGITYSKDGWGYHAWAEVYLDKWIPVDPTWNEIGWLDATHVEFGKFLDGGKVKVKTSYVSEEKKKVEISQPRPDVEIKETRPIQTLFSTEFESYPQSIAVGESSVLTIKTKTSASGCLATSLKINPRVDRQKRPIISVWGEDIISICPGEVKESHFIITSNTSLENGYTYYNLADIYTFLGEKKAIDLEIDPRQDDYSKLYLQLESQTAEQGEKIKFSVRSDSPHRTYSNLPIVGNEVVAYKKGSYYIIAATETGQVVKKDIEVRDNLKFKIKDIRKPSLVKCGEPFNVSFTIENLGEDYFEIDTEQSGELRYVPRQYLRTDKEEETVVLETMLQEDCTGSSQYLNILVNDQRIFEKIEAEKPVGFLEQLRIFFSSILNRISLFLENYTRD
ncbi:MAG: transglutaminase domain-containing protein [archaeon]|nr:MAG: transglutaminase domain-containing protein [archaeon]